MNPDDPPITPAVPANLTDSQADLPTPQRLAYARVLEWGCSLGFGGLLVAFVLYAAQVIPPMVPFREMPTQWAKPLEQFQQDTGMRDRWGPGRGIRWIGCLNCGEFVVYLPIAWMAGISFVSCAVLLPFYIRRRSYALLSVTALLLFVLAWAALVGIG